MAEAGGDRTEGLARISAMAERFSVESAASPSPVEPAIASFVSGLHQETVRIAGEFEAAASASGERSKPQSALAQSLQNQNEALSEQIQLLSRLLPREVPAGVRGSSGSSSGGALRGHRRVSSQHAVEEIKRQQEARRAVLEAWEVDLKEFMSFVHWRGARFPQAHPFCAAIEAAEVRPCLDFGPGAHEASGAILAAIKAEGGVALEPLRPSEGPALPCALCPELTAAYKLSGSSERPLLVSALVRNRVAAVCEFYHHVAFLRSHQASTAAAQHKEVFCKLQELRYAIALARLGLTQEECEDVASP